MSRWEGSPAFLDDSGIPEASLKDLVPFAAVEKVGSKFTDKYLYVIREQPIQAIARKKGEQAVMKFE